ncbi:hypothetical protein [Halobacterium bonnevillei]|uniref:Uncharacterized protein n=1 Tax=Halobacterium bonnevillei TaxID=2692200 RepID=A0A6B0SR68_9EURY|nr:hypothetical protein [Halobacterium bonnevillei]MXR22041.1 hypothetical protein [Halobacterium bonnevillei]
MSLADQFERAGIVAGAVLMVALPLSLALEALVGPQGPWWRLLAVLGPGFVVGWAAATDELPVSYSSVWFVCFLGYLLAVLGVRLLDLVPVGDHTGSVLGVLAVSFVVAVVADRFR